jgi:hypothetical protein
VNDGTPSSLTFGIYPGGAIGNTEFRPLPDQPDKINQALDELQGTQDRPFVVRAYAAYADPDDTVDTAHATTLLAPAGYDRYLGHGRTLDLVAQYHSRSGDIDGYCGFIENLIDSHGTRLATLQITEEPNITGDPNLDGFYPRVTEALIAGVRAAKHKAQSAGNPALRVGCNSSPLFGPDGGFFANLTRKGGQPFIEDLDYIGLDFFPDVFRPIAPASLGPVVQGLLRAHRRDNLAQAGLGHLPLVITEHGWPTGPGRTQTRQAEVLRTVVDVIAASASELNITGYIHHTLRDACSAGDGRFCQFGLMTDDYTPKPAFHVYRDLIDALRR